MGEIAGEVIGLSGFMDFTPPIDAPLCLTTHDGGEVMLTKDGTLKTR